MIKNIIKEIFNHKDLTELVDSLSSVEAISQNSMITNKAGRVVLKAVLNNKKVKVYETYSIEHAVFIERISQCLPDLMPKTYKIIGAWVVAEWVEGKQFNGLPCEEHVKIIKAFQQVPIPSDNNVGFCYWHDFIAPRFSRAATLFGQETLALEVIKQVDLEINKSSHLALMHPDLTPANLVKTDDGRLVSIDNELLCVSNLPILELCNAIRPLSKTKRDEIAASFFYNQAVTPSTLRSNALAWLAREIGAAFVEGDFTRCKGLFVILKTEPEKALPFEYSF